MTTEDLVCVVIPCHKMGAYIGKALESVGKQSYPHWEVIAVDDCGPEDGTRESVAFFGERHPKHRVKFIRLEENRGVSAARNTAIAESKAEFLAFLDPDDFWHEDYLKEHLSRLHEQGASVSYSNAILVDHEGKLMGGAWGPGQGELESFPLGLYRRNFINPSATVVRRKDVLDCGGFDESPEIQHVEDWDLWLRMVDGGLSFCFSPQAKVYYRKHQGAATTDPKVTQRRERALRHKHQDLPSKGTLAVIAHLEHQIRNLEGRQQGLEGHAFFRLSRVICQGVRKLFRK